MKKHRLSQVDFEQKTALCAVCGHTEIYVTTLHGQGKPIASCANGARENTRNYRARQKELLPQDTRPDRPPRHILSEVDPELQRAICSICGPTDIWKNTTKGYTRYYCATRLRAYMRPYMRKRIVARSSNPHALSNIDEEKKTAICAKCGPVKIEIRQGKRKLTRRCSNAKMEPLKAKTRRTSLGKMEE